MPSGIIIKSASHEVSDEVRDANVKAVIESAGYEVPEPEPPAEPKREDFKTEEEFETAHVEWQDKEEEKAAKSEEEEPPVPRKSRKTRAIERATAEYQAKIKELEAKLEAAGTGTKEKVEEPPKEEQEPKRTDFADDASYIKASVAWGVKKALADKVVEDAKAAQQAEFEQLFQNYRSQVEEAKDKYDDWDEVLNQDIDIGRSTQVALWRLENGAEVSYYLGRHPSLAKRLGQMNEVDAVMEVGRLSAKLLTGAPSTGEANGEGTTKPKPKVPAPVRTVNTGGPSANPTFAEIAERPNYPGKARDLRAALAKG